MSIEGFFKLPRSLTRDPRYLCAPGIHRHVLTTIADHMAFSECIVDDHGVDIHLKPGELSCSLQQLADWAGLKKKQVELALIRWTRESLRYPHMGQILGQRMGHRKCIFTALWDHNYKNVGQDKGQDKGHEKGQTRDKLGTQKKKEKKEEEVSKEEIVLNDPGAFEDGAITRRFFSLDIKTKTFIGISQKDIDGWKKTYVFLEPTDYFEEMADWLLEVKKNQPVYLNNIPRKFFTNWLSKHNLINQTNSQKGQKNAKQQPKYQPEFEDPRPKNRIVI